MMAFHNNPEFKAQLIEMAHRHQEADDYIKGTYGEEFDGHWRGCSVGCTVLDVCSITGRVGKFSDHGFLAAELGVPEFITCMMDAVFEGLPSPKYADWTANILTAIPVGADLTMVQPRFLLALQQRRLAVVDRAAHPGVYAAIAQVVGALSGWVGTGTVDLQVARSAAWTASSAWPARSARSAWSAAESAARSERSAWSAWSAVESARSAAWSAAESAEYTWMAKKLIELVKECKQ